MSGLTTPWGPARLLPGTRLQVAARDTRAAMWALGRHQGRHHPGVIALGMARAGGRSLSLDPTPGAALRDHLFAALSLDRRARRLLAAAPPLFRRQWEAYAAGLARGYGESGAPPPPTRITPATLAAWDLLVAAIPEAGILFDRPTPLASNGAVLAGSRVVGGGGMLWFDPHVPLSPRGELALSPAVIRSPGYSACGIIRVGSPFVLVGAGPARAWTLCASTCAATGRGGGKEAGRRGWWRRPGERTCLRPAFVDCPLPSRWFWAAARGASAPELIRHGVYNPPLAHTHLLAADRTGRIGYGLALAGHRDCPRPRSAGGGRGWLVQCNAGWARVDPRCRGGARFPLSPPDHASWRHCRAQDLVGGLVARQGRLRATDLLPVARDLYDPCLALLAKRLAPLDGGGELARWRGRAGRTSPGAALAALTLEEVLRRRRCPDPHQLEPLTTLIGRLDARSLAGARRRARQRWQALGCPTWGELHRGRGGTMDTLAAAGGLPWQGPRYPADHGSLQPGIVRLGPRGASFLLPDPAGRRAPERLFLARI